MGIGRIIKKFLKWIIYRPGLSRLGANSLILLPRWIYNKKHISIGDNSIIGRFAILHPIKNYGQREYSSKILIGNNVYIGGFSQIHCMELISIDDGCVLSEHVYISDIAHGLVPDAGLIMEQDLECKGPVYIGANTFIGYGVSVMPGVTLGKNCIVGTRSVVTHSFPDYSMIAGSPAKLLKTYCFKEKEWIKPT